MRHMKKKTYEKPKTKLFDIEKYDIITTSGSSPESGGAPDGSDGGASGGASGGNSDIGPWDPTM